MDKVYSSHEFAYQRLKNKGAKSWHEMYATPEGKKVDHIGFSRKSFIEDVLEKDWSPKKGNALEIGSGTGHLIKFIEDKGFKSSGIEISETAIELAKENHKNSNIVFNKGDYCHDEIFEDKSLDLIIDGSCFHCVVEENDRKIFIEKTKNLLTDNGVFILMTMCTPIDKKAFKKNFKTQIFEKDIFYVKYDVELEGSKMFNNEMYMAQRKIPHWKDILKMLKNNGFNIKLFRYEQDEIFSSIFVAMTKK